MPVKRRWLPRLSYAYLVTTFTLTRFSHASLCAYPGVAPLSETDARLVATEGTRFNIYTTVYALAPFLQYIAARRCLGTNANLVESQRGGVSGSVAMKLISAGIQLGVIALTIVIPLLQRCNA
jgi:hypothetical protein